MCVAKGVGGGGVRCRPEFFVSSCGMYVVAFVFHLFVPKTKSSLLFLYKRDPDVVYRSEFYDKVLLMRINGGIGSRGGTELKGA